MVVFVFVGFMFRLLLVLHYKEIQILVYMWILLFLKGPCRSFIPFCIFLQNAGGTLTY